MTSGVLTIRVDGAVQWNCLRARGGNWVGVCDPLQLTVQAETYADLMEDIGLTLNAVLKDLLETNELPQFLRERGWVLEGGRIPSREEDVRFDVPFIPAMMGANGPQREFHQ